MVEDVSGLLVPTDPGGSGAQTVYGRLRERIVSGALTPGTPLVEGVLAKAYGVSRSPVREALGHLMNDGLLERRDRALQVRVLRPEEVLDLFEVRIALERAAARAAAERRTELDLGRLAASVEGMRGLGVDATERRPALGFEFHQLLWQASHNPALVDTLQTVRLRVVALTPTTLFHTDRWAVFLDGCEQIVDAVRARDVTRAGDVAERYVTEARDYRLKLYTSPEPTEPAERR